MYSTVNFGGFYNSFHDYICERAVAYEIGAVDDDGEINGDKLFDYNDWERVHNNYASEWLDALNSELDTNLKFVSLDSPKFYNYSTDTIHVSYTHGDALKLFKYIKDNDLKGEVYRIIKDRTTSCDGYHAFYKYADIFAKDGNGFLIEFMLDAIIDSLNADYPFVLDDFYC